VRRVVRVHRRKAPRLFLLYGSDRIEGLPAPAADCRVFHAGTRLESGTLVTNGGRVLCVTALGDSLRIARSRAYEAIERIRYDGMQYRRDIGHRALKKSR